MVAPLKYSNTKKEAQVNSTIRAYKNIVKIIEQLDKLLPSNFVSKQGREGSTKTLKPVGQRQQKAGNMEERYI